MKDSRVLCCIPHCRRTIATERVAPHTQWLCGSHWPLVPKKLRGFKLKADRTYERSKDVFFATFHEADEHAKSNNGGVSDEIIQRLHQASDRREKARQRCLRTWDRCKRRAIETAMGI